MQDKLALANLYFILLKRFLITFVMQVNVMLKEFPEEELGPSINIREYSFLDNPSMPKQVHTSLS